MLLGSKMLSCLSKPASYSDGSRNYIILFRHRRIAERVAAALAPSVADATSSMYNNITDYVLGPMHGHPYPVAPEPRPLPSDPQTPSDGCWPDDSDSEPEDPGTSQLLLVTDADSTMDSAASALSPFGSLRVNLDPTSPQAASSQQPIAESVEQQQPLDDTPRARHSPKRAMSPRSLCDHPSRQRGGDSAFVPHTQSSPCHAAVSTSAFTTAQRRTVNTLSELRRQFSQDDSARASFTFALPLFWIKPKRSRSDDSAQENDGHRTNTHIAKGSAEDGSRIEAKTQWPAQAIAHGSYKQHSFLLQFRDTAVEKHFCLWQAQQRIKVCMLMSKFNLLFLDMSCLLHHALHLL